MRRNGVTGKILKAIGLFSGAEAVGIVCSIVKMKLVALWLGATGVGLFGIFNSSIDTISILTGFGLRQSSVREIARAGENKRRLRELARLLRSWSWAVGLLGSVAMSALSPLLSLWFFGEPDQWWQFMIVSGSLLLSSLTGAEQAMLQGRGLFRRLARANMTGAVAGLVVSIPMFRFFGEESVICSILAYGAAMLVSLMISRERGDAYRLSSPKEMRKGLDFVRLGGYMAVATFATNLAQMIFLSWLNREASMAEVGYFQAGNTLVIRYTSLIFSAVGMEFYPRMSANSHSPRRMSMFVSHETNLLLSIFTPLLILFLVFQDLIIRILYTPDFLVIRPFITIAILTVILKSVSNCMAFSILAKGEGRVYMFTETFDAIVGVALNILFYRLYGLPGIGVALVLWYLSYTLMISLIYFFRYRLTITRRSLLVLAASLVISLTAVFICLC